MDSKNGFKSWIQKMDLKVGFKKMDLKVGFKNGFISWIQFLIIVLDSVFDYSVGLFEIISKKLSQTIQLNTTFLL